MLTPARLLALITLLSPFAASGAQYYYYHRYGEANPFEALRLLNLIDSPSLLDVDGDGDHDLVVLEFDRFRLAKNTGTAAVPVFTGLETENFQAVTLPAGSKPAFGKVDADNDFDLVVGTPAGTFRYFSNTGTAASMTLTERTGAANPFNGIDIGIYARPTVVDIDGDGDGDVVSGSYTDDLLVLLRNTGTAAVPVFALQAFAPLAAVNVDSPEPAFFDTDGDGDLDLVVNGSAFFTNTGTAAAPVYVRDTVTFIPGGLHEPAIGDMNQDGKPELLSVTSFGYVTQDPAPQASPVTEDTTLSAALSAKSFDTAATGDIDGDGDLDLMIAGEEISGPLFLRNTGTPTAPAWAAWTPAPVFPGLASAHVAAMADVDGDGDFDVLAWADPAWKFYRNTGSRTAPAFTLQTDAEDPFHLSKGHTTVSFGDLDGDGDLDFVTGHSTGDTTQAVRYFQNTGSATAPAYVQLTGAPNPFDLTSWMQSASPTLVDWDRDGDLDALIGGWYQLLYLRNDGTRFAPSFTLVPGAESPFIGIPLGFTLFYPLAGEWKNGGAMDLILGKLRSEQGASAQFFTGNSPATGFPAWQSANFALPAEISLAAADADPDKDGVVNLIEYAVKTPPKIPGARPEAVVRNGAGALQMVLDVRDDDPALSAVGHSGSAPSTLSGNIAPVITDPVPGDGLKRWTFTDQPPAGSSLLRFLRARFTLN